MIRDVEGFCTTKASQKTSCLGASHYNSSFFESTLETQRIPEQITRDCTSLSNVPRTPLTPEPPDPPVGIQNLSATQAILWTSSLVATAIVSNKTTGFVGNHRSHESYWCLGFFFAFSAFC